MATNKAKKETKTKTAPRRKPAAKAAARRKATAKDKRTDARRPMGKRAALEALALAGRLPPPPNFAAETHAYYRPKLAELIALARAGDAVGLAKFEINPTSTSPKALARYRDLCVTALKSRK